MGAFDAEGDLQNFPSSRKSLRCLSVELEGKNKDGSPNGNFQMNEAVTKKETFSVTLFSKFESFYLAALLASFPRVLFHLRLYSVSVNSRKLRWNCIRVILAESTHFTLSSRNPGVK